MHSVLRAQPAVRIVHFVRRVTLRTLISLLLLLALFAGGRISAVMAMPMASGSSLAADAQMPDANCKACGAGTMATALCDALCAALPAIDATVAELGVVGSHGPWILRAESGPTHFIGPDTSPPRT